MRVALLLAVVVALVAGLQAADVAADRIQEDLCRQEIALEPTGLEPPAEPRAGFDWKRVDRPDALEIPPTAAAEPGWRAVADSGRAGLWFEDAGARSVGCLVDDVHRHVHALDVHDEEGRILESRRTSCCWGAPSSAWSDPAGQVEAMWLELRGAVNRLWWKMT